MKKNILIQDATDLITDYQLLFDLQSKLSEESNKYYQRKQLKKIKLCLTGAANNGVALQAKTDTKRNITSLSTVGACHCHSVFCPVCAPYRMNQYKTLLASAFKMFEQQNKACIMVTFTVPNSKKLTFWQNFSVLKVNLNKFLTSGSYKKFKKLIGATDIFHAFDVTYGKNGWHPHYHSLIWFDKDKFNLIEKYELNLRYVWEKQFAKIINHQIEENEISQYTQGIQSIKPDDYSKEVQTKFIDKVKNLKEYVMQNDKESGFYISKNKDGKIRKATNSNYFWSATNETTGGKFKQAHEGQRTVWQLLNDALYNNDELAWEKWKEITADSYGLQLYRLSKNTKQKILDWQQQHPEEYEKISKKKFIKKELIIWLPKDEWYFFKNYFPNILGNISKLLYLKILIPDLQQILKKICDLYNIKCSLEYNPYDNLSTANKNVA